VKSYQVSISFSSLVLDLQPDWHWANQWKEFKVCNCRADVCCGQSIWSSVFIQQTWHFYACVLRVNLWMEF